MILTCSFGAEFVQHIYFCVGEVVKRKIVDSTEVSVELFEDISVYCEDGSDDLSILDEEELIVRSIAEF